MLSVTHAFQTIAPLAALVALASVSCSTAESNAPELESFSFDEASVGDLPPGWRVAATRQDGPLATWQVIADATAPSPGRALALIRPNHESRGTFNLCWMPDASFQDCEIAVRFKAQTGVVDQGGGIIWRALDADNYYIARFNPLEDNFRVYTVKGGVRKQLASTTIQLAQDQWHSMKIIQQGDHYQAFLNGQMLLEDNDSTFTAAGGVGLWTKADAVTSFDNFSVIERGRGLVVRFPPSSGESSAIAFDALGPHEMIHRKWQATVFMTPDDGEEQLFQIPFNNGMTEDAMASIVSDVLNVEFGDGGTWVKEVEAGPDQVVTELGTLHAEVKRDQSTEKDR